MVGVKHDDKIFWSHKTENSVNFFNTSFGNVLCFVSSLPEVAYSRYLCIPKFLQKRK